MGLEKRGTRFYYYKKNRSGGRVSSEYYGSGDVARMIAILEAEAQDKAATEIEAGRSELEATAAALELIDAMLDDAIGQTDRLVDALHLVNGYHKHSRSWRRKRNGEI